MNRNIIAGLTGLAGLYGASFWHSQPDRKIPVVLDSGRGVNVELYKNCTRVPIGIAGEGIYDISGDLHPDFTRRVCGFNLQDTDDRSSTQEEINIFNEAITKAGLKR